MCQCGMRNNAPVVIGNGRRTSLTASSLHVPLFIFLLPSCCSIDSDEVNIIVQSIQESMRQSRGTRSNITLCQAHEMEETLRQFATSTATNSSYY